ncbi:hypothetical protein KUCAC02_022452 [Chaenocephalus aceratus]|uniref:Uncharacterized protein n=1 Tax=Chaenocephalus aceratus TaxID=36190 RepID=A0ACB9XND1_CHAAC|nr:hypothetical protein KUCAC02_022452 [Chaenocephalus aceratus]
MEGCQNYRLSYPLLHGTRSRKESFGKFLKSHRNLKTEVWDRCWRGFQLTEGPSKPAPLAVQFTSEGSILSGCDIELAGPGGYRFSLIKKRFAAGKYLADN